MTTHKPSGAPASSGGQFETTPTRDQSSKGLPAVRHSANDVAVIDEDAFHGYEKDLEELRSEINTDDGTYPENMNVEFTPETYWGARDSGRTVNGICSCSDGESGIYVGQPDQVVDWMREHSKGHPHG